jgi:hypothetical protein
MKNEKDIIDAVVAITAISHSFSGDKKQKQLDNKLNAKRKMKEVKTFSETIEQELSSQKFLEENSNFIFVGKTNKKNLIFENKDKQIKISPDGIIL